MIASPCLAEWPMSVNAQRRLKFFAPLRINGTALEHCGQQQKHQVVFVLLPQERSLASSGFTAVGVRLRHFRAGVPVDTRFQARRCAVAWLSDFPGSGLRCVVTADSPFPQVLAQFLITGIAYGVH